MATTQPSPLREVATLFLRLGATAFGGPAAHIAMMRTELVQKRGWMTDQEYLDLIGAANLIPGPSSTEVAMHVGRAGTGDEVDRKSTRLNSSHPSISYAVFCLKKKKKT